MENDIIPSMKKALIVEDDNDSATGFKKLLTGMGFACTIDTYGDMALQLLESGEFDIAIVDIVLPLKVSGSDIIRTARARGVKTPIIGVSDKVGAETRANDLRAGATDHMTKPCHPAEFRERVLKAINGAGPESYLVSGDIIVDTENHMARRGDRVLELTPLLYELLIILLRAKGQPVSNARLRVALGLSAMPSGQDPLDPGAVVRANVKRLRKELVRGGEPDPITTTRFNGYAIQ